MRKFIYLVSVVAFSLLTGCQKENGGTTEPGLVPEIKLDPAGEIRVSGEINNVVVAYEIINPVENGRLEMRPSAEWIEINSDSGSEVSITVGKNDEDVERYGTVTFSYVYGEGKAVNTSAVILQQPGTNYDYAHEATVITAYYYGDRNSVNGEHNFDTYLSSKPFADGSPMNDAFYYRLDFWSPAPEDPSAPLPAAGTYTFGEMFETKEFTFSDDFSYYTILDAQGEIYLTSYFYDGTVTIDYDGDNIIIDAVLTDETYNYVHHVTYTGPVEYTIL